MYRFIRTATCKNAVDQGPALKFAGEISAYLNKVYSLNVKCGIELFAKGRVHWHFDIDSIDKGTAINAKLLQDREYAGMLEKTRALFVEGSLKDTILTLVG